LFVVAKDEFTGPSKDFMRWVLTDGQKYVLDTGYIPLSEDVLREQVSRLG
jgi:phosphate transport system substrate-binding protein